MAKRVKKKVIKEIKKKNLKITKDLPQIPITSPELDRVEREISKPSAWTRAVQQNQNVSPSYIWSINKERIYENYGNRMRVYYDTDGNEEMKPLTYEPRCEHIKPSHEVLVLPSGKVITPIRQFCETKILPTGVKEAFFFDFGSIAFNTDAEGVYVDPTITTSIRSNGVETNARGTRIDIGYQQTEESPIDIIASANRAFALESINDETKQILNAFNNDTPKTKYNRVIGGGVKGKHWVDGYGRQISDDSDITEYDRLTIKGLLKASEIIALEGMDTSNLVLYTTGKAIRDLIEDPHLNNYSNAPQIKTLRTIEKITGIKIIRTGACPKTSSKTTDAPENILQKIVRIFWGKPRNKITINGTGTRSVLFVPNVTFGLVSGRDLTMEAHRRNEIQAISITGTQKIAGLVKNLETCVRISHA